jgi:sugar phosphate isomerase/epimerase
VTGIAYSPKKGAELRLGVLLAGRRPDEITKRFEQARDAGFFLCQFNLCQSGFSRADIVAIADAGVDMGVRPVAVGCHLNPLSPDQPAMMGGTRADLDLILHSLDILGARRVVLWSGTHASGLYDDHEDNIKAESLDIVRDFLTDVVNTTRARHYSLCLEPWHTHVLRSEDDIVAFHDTLEPRVQERVRYVLDVPSLITEARYADCNAAAEKICRTMGPLTGIVHLRDVIMPPDGEASLPGPCQGKLDYAAYLQNIFDNVETDVPAVVRNVTIPEFSEVRDRLLRLSDRWELA